jgi:hypothetical protein
MHSLSHIGKQTGTVMIDNRKLSIIGWSYSDADSKPLSVAYKHRLYSPTTIEFNFIFPAFCWWKPWTWFNSQRKQWQKYLRISQRYRPL